MSLAGFVVAGGRSARMGQDKAMLLFSGQTLLDHAITKLRAVTDHVFVLCGPTRRYEECGVPVIEDAICGAGPAGGLYSALASAQARGHLHALWLAVDLPLVPVSVLTSLVDPLGDADVAMARTDTGLEPLCAAFRTTPCLTAVRHAILRGRLKLTDALAGLNLHEAEADATLFANINSPAEYNRLAR